MSTTKKPPKTSGCAAFDHETPSTPVDTMQDKSFSQALLEYIEREKESIQCSEEGPSEELHIIYSSAFDQVIENTTVYKGLLLKIKKEYDDFISDIKWRNQQAKQQQSRLRTQVAQPLSLLYCQQRALQLQDRLAIIHRDTAEIHTELAKLQGPQMGRTASTGKKTSDNEELEPVRLMPGLTPDESWDLTALTKHLEQLKSERAALQTQLECQRLSSLVKTDLDRKMEDIQEQRDQLIAEGTKLTLLHKRLKYVSDSLLWWDEDEQDKTDLEEILNTTLDNLNKREVTVDDDCPIQANEMKAMMDYIERFINMFERGDYKAAAFHAARSPHGVLRTIETMEKFKSVTEYRGELPPAMLFFEALMVTAPGSPQLSEQALCVEGVRCALELNLLQLVTHGVTQHKLMFSVALGDVIYEQAEREPQRADMCLALAHIVYATCGQHRKAALSMCKRGMLHGALEFISHCQNFTTEDCVCLLRGCPSMALLQLLTESYQGHQAMMSLGQACLSLLAEPQLEHLSLQLLEDLHSGGEGVLEKRMLEDSRCGVEDWGDIADQCARRNHTELSQEILSVLLAQCGIIKLSSGPEEANLMEHVFM